MTYQPTSRLAYHETKKQLGRRQLEVLEALLQKPQQTNAELSRSLGWQINTVTPRVLELRKLGKVRLWGERRCKVSGYTAMVWEPVTALEQVPLFGTPA